MQKEFVLCCRKIRSANFYCFENWQSGTQQELSIFITVTVFCNLQSINIFKGARGNRMPPPAFRKLFSR